MCQHQGSLIPAKTNLAEQMTWAVFNSSWTCTLPFQLNYYFAVSLYPNKAFKGSLFTLCPFQEKKKRLKQQESNRFMSKKKGIILLHMFFLVLLDSQSQNPYVAWSNWQLLCYPKEKGSSLFSELSPDSASSCFCTSRGLPQGPEAAAVGGRLCLSPLVMSIAPSTIQQLKLFVVSGNSHYLTPSSGNETQPTRNPKTQICPMWLTKLNCPTERKWTRSLSKCWMSFR